MAYYTYDGCCGSCIYMNTNDYYRHKDNCYCTYRNHYYDLKEAKCRYYQYDKNKDYYDLNHRWHVVSAIFNKLGLCDSYDCIRLLHDFRIDCLEKDVRFKQFLIQYDIIGPLLAKCIIEDIEAEKLCKKLIQVYLVDILDDVKNNNNYLAFQKYLTMLNLLKIIYQDALEDYLKIKSSSKNMIKCL